MKFKKIHIFRLKPDQDIIKGIIKYCDNYNISSGVIISLIGSLKEVNLGYLKKLPGKFITKKFKGPLEIASGTGTVALLNHQTMVHIHLTVSNQTMAIAGHLNESVIFSTAEIVIGETSEKIYRIKDNVTGLNELKNN